jgi:hypothetical protein
MYTRYVPVGTGSHGAAHGGNRSPPLTGNGVRVHIEAYPGKDLLHILGPGARRCPHRVRSPRSLGPLSRTHRVKRPKDLTVKVDQPRRPDGGTVRPTVAIRR